MLCVSLNLLSKSSVKSTNGSLTEILAWSLSPEGPYTGAILQGSEPRMSRLGHYCRNWALCLQRSQSSHHSNLWEIKYALISKFYVHNINKYVIIHL